MLLIVCGVSGVGKTTVGMLLSEALDIPFYDADAFHPSSNIEKMTSGTSLDDEDRKPWLEVLARNLSTWQEDGGAVLACSALKETHRAILGSQCSYSITWIVLHASRAVLSDRLESRKVHFFDQQLLSSQLKAFEAPDYGWLVNAEASPRDIVADVLSRLRGNSELVNDY